MAKSTMVELVEELERLPSCDEVKFLIAEARLGEYHDFKNNKYACGKMALAGLLYEFCKTQPDLADDFMRIRKDVVGGEYDEEADDQDRATMCAFIDNDERMTGKQKNKLKEAVGLKNNVKHGPWGKKYFN